MIKFYDMKRDLLKIRDHEVRLYFWKLYDSHTKQGLTDYQAKTKTYDDIEVRFFIQKKSVDIILSKKGEEKTKFPEGLMQARSQRLKSIIKTVDENI